MKFENALIIALIILIFVVIGAYFFVNGTGVSEEQTQEPAISANPATDTVNPDSQSSSGGSGAVDTSGAADSSSDTDQPADDTSDVSSADSSTPQAGQAEGTYDPTDFD